MSKTKRFYPALVQSLKAAREQLAEYRAMSEAERAAKEAWEELYKKR
jgi:hypothetical protein